MKPTPIDWEFARNLLRAGERAVEEASLGSPARISSAYRQRAVRLAGKPVEPGGTGTAWPALTFLLDQERYAILLSELAEVAQCLGYTKVPGSPLEFPAVVHLRGEILPVLDLSRLLGSPPRGEPINGFVLILRQNVELALRVDAVEALSEIRPEELTVSSHRKFAKGFIGSTATTLLSVETMLAEVLSKASVFEG